jgi:hypothetical protein
MAEVLDYRTRHAHLAVLLADSKSARLVDTRLNLALDLLQASESPAPCTTFRETLKRIEANTASADGGADRYYYEDTLTRSRAPQPGAVAAAGKPPDGDCSGLEEQRFALLASMAPEEGEPFASAADRAADDDSPAADEPRSSRRARSKDRRSRPKKKTTRTARPDAPSAKKADANASSSSAAPWERRGGPDEVKNPFE